MKIKILISVMLLFTLSGYSQNKMTGEITGKVMDHTTNTPLIAANVMVVGTQLGAATNADGEYRITNVPVGVQAVRVSVIGYKIVVKSDISVNSVKPSVVNFELAETVIEFDELMVRPEYFESSTDRPISTQTQSNEEIRRLPGGFEDVVRAISILPGVGQVTGGRNDLIVRGGAPSENLYVVDGIEVPNINHFGTQGASGGPISFINLDFVSGTTFSSGGFGSRYGDKLSSVLTLDLRDGRTDRWGGKATIAASQFGLDLEGPVGKNGSTLFSARRSYLDFIFKANGFGFVPEYWDFLSKTTYDLGKSDQLRVLGIAALDKTNFLNDTDENRYDNSQILGSTQNQFMGGITWKHVFSGGFSEMTLGQSLVDYDYFQNDTLQNPIFRNLSLEHETSLTENVVFNLTKSTEVTTGLQGKYVRLHSDIYLPSMVDEYGFPVSLELDERTSAYKGAGWLQLAQNWGPLDVIAGLRYDYFNMINDKNAVSPRISLRYAFSNLTSVKMSAGRYYQAPSYIWLMTNSENKKLKHIAANQYIFGIEHLLRDDTIVSIEAYYKQYDDYPSSLPREYLVLANTGAGYGGASEGYVSFGIDPMVSKGKGKAHGAELFVQKKFSSSPLYGTFSLSYNNARFTALDGIERAGSYEQRWIMNLGGGYVFGQFWELSTRIRYATGRPYTPYEPDFSRSPEKFNTLRVQDNYFIDLRIDRRWYMEKISLITYIDVQNLLNRDVYDVPSFNLYKGTIENTGGVGILPSIGISAEF